MAHYDIMMLRETFWMTDGILGKCFLNEISDGDKEVPKKKGSFETVKQKFKNIPNPLKGTNYNFVKDSKDTKDTKDQCIYDKEDVYSQFDVDTDHLY
jgi:hypothetical protein